MSLLKFQLSYLSLCIILSIKLKGKGYPRTGREGFRWEWLVNVTARLLYPRERCGTHYIGGWLGPSTGLNGCENLAPTGIRSADVQPVASRYTDLTIPDLFVRQTRDNFLLTLMFVELGILGNMWVKWKTINYLSYLFWLNCFSKNDTENLDLNWPLFERAKESKIFLSF